MIPSKGRTRFAYVYEQDMYVSVTHDSQYIR